MGACPYIVAAGALCRWASAGILLVAGGEERLRGIQETTRRGAPPTAILVFLGLGLIVVISVLVHLIATALRRRREIRDGWSALSAKLRSLELGPADRRLLQALAARQCPERPLALLEEVEQFEAAVHAHFASLSKGEPGEASARASEQVRLLRQALGFDSPPDVVYHSSRQIAQGQEVRLFRGQTEDAFARAFVAERREDFLPLRDVEPPQEGLAERAAKVKFFTGGRSYVFRTRVVRCGDLGRSCLLEHTLNVEMADRREYYRVRLEDASVSFRAAWEEPDVAREGRLRDLSAGGACIVAACFYEQGEQLVVHLRPDDYLPDAARTGEERLPEKTFSGLVVRAARIPGEQCRYHLQFSDVLEADRRYLLRLVRQVEMSGKE